MMSMIREYLPSLLEEANPVLLEEGLRLFEDD
jgi:hypothetical protein